MCDERPAESLSRMGWRSWAGGGGKNLSQRTSNDALLGACSIPRPSGLLFSFTATLTPSFPCSSQSRNMQRVDNLPSPQPHHQDFAHSNSSVVSAYTTCRLAERLVLEDRRPPCNESEGTKLVNIRILGHLLSQSYFLSEYSISEVARAVLSCRDPLRGVEADVTVEGLNELGEFYRNYLLRPCECQASDPKSPSLTQ